MISKVLKAHGNALFVEFERELEERAASELEACARIALLTIPDEHKVAGFPCAACLRATKIAALIRKRAARTKEGDQCHLKQPGL